MNQIFEDGRSPSEVRYSHLVEAITDCAVCMLDETGNVIAWNSGAERFHGYKQKEIIGQPYSCFFAANEPGEGMLGKACEVAAREGRFEAEGWQVKKDGSRFWAHVIIDPVHGSSGELTGFAQVTRDLSERKTAEAALKRSEEQFSLLVQSVTDYAIFMLDPQGTIVSWNAGAQRIKGYAPEEIIGKHFSRFYTPEDRQNGMPRQALCVAAKEGRFEAEGWRVRKDGTRFCASVVIDAIRDERGELLGFAKVTRDVTERVESQRALEEAREALFQAQKLEAIGQLTGGVAHDFNNLLMVVLSSLDLMRKQVADDDKLIGLLDNASQAAHRGSALVQRMLAFARRQDLDRKAVDLPELVRGMSDLMQRSIGPAVRIETRFPIVLPRVETDSNQLEAALLNLAVNARDAMPAGGSLIISAREEAIGAGHSTNLPLGNYVCLSVQDEGEGMDGKTLARATDPFFSTKGVGKGTGLGLSMVQGFAEQSGGRLLLMSKPNAGTTAEIWLPSAQMANNNESEEQAKPVTPTETDRQKLTVLAVDDDALVLMNTTAMLEDLGHTVFEASSGTQALEILHQQPEIDLIVSDQAMPGMTGVQLMEALRSEWPDLPIVLATGYAELPEGVRSDLPLLSKPFSQEQLAEALQTVTTPKKLSTKIVDLFRSA